jgi:hypothetical protein
MLLVGGWLRWPGDCSSCRLTALLLGRLLGVLLFTEARSMGRAVRWSPMKPKSWSSWFPLSLRRPAPIAGYIATYRTCHANCWNCHMWEPSMGSSHRLSNSYRGNTYANRYPSNSPINRISMVTNNCNNAWIVPSSVYTWVRLKAVNETTWISSVSQLDASDRLTRTSLAVQFASSRGMFCKLQRNHRQEQVGEDFTGNQPDQLTLWLHRASLNSTPHHESLTPNSLQAATPSADFNYRRPAIVIDPQPVTSKLRTMQLVYLQSVSIKVHTICNWELIVGITPQKKYM